MQRKIFYISSMAMFTLSATLATAANAVTRVGPSDDDPSMCPARPYDDPFVKPQPKGPKEEAPEPAPGKGPQDEAPKPKPDPKPAPQPKPKPSS